MKIPVQLSKGLSNEQLGLLETQLKSSLLAKQLRKVILKNIESSYEEEESLLDANPSSYLKAVGERRGYRHVLNLLPEDSND